jgi:hypothetical protein
VIYSDAMPVSDCANGMCGSSPIYGAAVALPAATAAVSGDSATEVAPVVPATSEGSLEVMGDTEQGDITEPSVGTKESDPVVDPGAFIPRTTGGIGS